MTQGLTQQAVLGVIVRVCFFIYFLRRVIKGDRSQLSGVLVPSQMIKDKELHPIVYSTTSIARGIREAGYSHLSGTMIRKYSFECFEECITRGIGL